MNLVYSTSKYDDSSDNRRKLFFHNKFGIKSKRHTLHYFFSMYISFLCILIAIFFAFSVIANNIMVSQTMRIAQNVLHEGLIELNGVLASYKTAANTLIGYSDILTVSNYNLNSHYRTNWYRMLTAYNYFNNIAGTMNYRHDCGIILKNGMIIMPRRFYTSGGGLLDNIFRCVDYASFDEWKEVLSSVYNDTLLPVKTYRGPDGEETEDLTYVIRYSLSNSGVYDTIFFVTLRKTDAVKLLMSSGDLQGTLTLYNTQGDLLLQTEGGKGSHVVTAESSTGIQASIILDDAYLSEQTASFRRITGIAFTAFLLIGFAIAWILAKHSAAPLKTLADAAGEAEPGSIAGYIERLPTYEYRCCLSALADFRSSLRSYSDELAKFKDQTLYLTLVGMLIDEPVASDIQTDCIFVGSGFRVLALIRPVSHDSRKCAALIDILRNILPGNSMVVSFHNDVVAFADADEKAEIDADIRDVALHIDDFACRIAVSEPCADPKSVHSAYQQLCHLLRGPSSEPPYDFTQSLPPAFACLRAINYSDMMNLLLSKDLTMLQELFDGIRTCMTDCYADVYSVRYAYDVIVCALLSVGCQYSFELTIPPYDRYTSYDAIFEQLRNVSISAVQSIQSYDEQAYSRHSRDIVHYIDLNIVSPALYTRMITEHFNISEQELQARVREVTGQSFFCYVESSRMNIAKELVMKTEQSFTEISARCGYNSNISFSRAFNRYYKMTPSKMRSNGFHLNV